MRALLVDGRGLSALGWKLSNLNTVESVEKAVKEVVDRVQTEKGTSDKNLKVRFLQGHALLCWNNK